MGIGGQLPTESQPHETGLIMAYTGRTRFDSTGWNRCHASKWILDYLNRGKQEQAIGHLPTFVRPSGVAALYEPDTQYRERRYKGKSVDESYIQFCLSEDMTKSFQRLTGSRGWSHVRDPDAVIESRLRRLGEVLFYKGPGHILESRGIFLELLGILQATVSIGPELRQVRRAGHNTGAGEDMAAVVERYIREHISEQIDVEDLANEIGMSESTFAHKYPDTCGETPYQTVLRLKIESAKRLLLWENMSVKKTAAQTGFSTPFHLSRVFKTQEGLSPMQWKESLRKNGDEIHEGSETQSTA